MTTPNKESGEAHGESAPTLTRGPELVVGLVLMAIAGMVITDSLRVGTGWGDDGPRSGYFPFYIGLFLLTASAFVVLSTLLKWGKLKEVFATREELVPVFQKVALKFPKKLPFLLLANLRLLKYQLN
jgi:hypothetical protein